MMRNPYAALGLDTCLATGCYGVAADGFPFCHGCLARLPEHLVDTIAATKSDLHNGKLVAMYELLREAKAILRSNK